MSLIIDKPWTTKGCGTGTQMFIGDKYIMSAPVIEIDEEREDGESWLSMRHRTQPKRDEAAKESEAIVNLAADAPALLDALEMYVNKVGAAFVGVEEHEKSRALIAKHMGGK